MASLKSAVLVATLALTIPAAAVVPGQVIELGSSRGTVHLPDVADAVAGAGMGWGSHAGVVIRADGTLATWGYNAGGAALVAPAGLRDVTQVEAGEFNVLVLRRDGTVATFPSMIYNGFSLDAPAGLANVRAIAAGRGRCYAVINDGTVVAWGEVTVPAGLTNVAAISAGEGGYDVALRTDGTVVAWKQPYWSLLDSVSVPDGLANVVAVSAGYTHALALRSDGTVAAWGTNAGTPVNVPAGLSDVVEICALENFSAARKRDGSIVIWGGGYFGLTMQVPQNFVGATRLFADRTALYAIAGPRKLSGAVSFPMSAGDDVALAAPAEFAENATLQWRRNGAAIVDATARTLILPFLQPGDGGTYDVVANGDTANASPAATVTVSSGNGHSAYLANISTRGIAGSGESTMIAGFYFQGTTARTMIVRAVGPGLAAFGVNGCLEDPQLDLRRGSRSLGLNGDWHVGNDAESMRDSFGTVGAFGLPAGSKDAALRENLIAGGYTMLVTGAGTARGIALAECYDHTYVIEATNVPYGGQITGRLVNISTRAEVGVGAEVLIGGFVVRGSGSQRLLIRGVGPELRRSHGITTALAETRITLWHGNRIVASNSGWSTHPHAQDIAASVMRVSAFELPADSKDSALLIEVQPGSYTAILESPTGEHGVGLVEIYEDDST